MNRKTELDKDIASYIAQRKGKFPKKEEIIEWLRQIIPKKTKPVPIEMPPEIESYDEKKQELEKSEKVEIVDNIQKEYEQEKQTVFDFILTKIHSLKRKQPLEKEKDLSNEIEEEKIKDLVEKEMILQDLRDLAKITLFIIKQLPEGDLKRFKTSSDFDDLKVLLKKHSLIK